MQSLSNQKIEWSSFPRPPQFWRFVGVFFLIITLATIVTIIFGKVSHKVSSKGILVYSNGQTKVMAQKAGIVSDVLVTDGQLVTIDRPLIQISTDDDSESGTTDSKALASVDAQISALQVQKQSLLNDQKIDLEKSKAHLDKEVSDLGELQKTLPLLQSKVELTHQMSDRGKELEASGVISTLQKESFDFTYMDQKMALINQERQVANLKDSIASDKFALQKLPDDQQSAIAAINQQMEALRERRVTIAGSAGYTIKAKSNGRLNYLQVQDGDVINAFQPLAIITPEGGKIIAQLFIPSEDIGFVRIGQQVRILYDAYPYQKYGVGYGIVSYISSSVLKPTEVSSDASVGEAAYLVRVSLDKQPPIVEGSNGLKPGMSLTAEIVVDKQSIISMIMMPLRELSKSN